MEQHNIVRRFGDGYLILDDGIGFSIKIARLLSPLDSLMQLANAFTIFIIAAQRCVYAAMPSSA